jgi:uncharacterized protein (DUF1501 family)
MHDHPLSRRQVLQSLGAGLSLTASPRVWAQAVKANPKNLDQGRLVVVFLRGAYDGLSAFVPYTDTDYYKLRPNIAIAPPDGSALSALKLDDTFAMHPAMAPLMPLWQRGVLGFVPAAGLPAPNRSHFDAQYQMEIAHAGKTSGVPGWLNKLAGLGKPSTTAAIGVGESNPTILSGKANIKLIARGQAAQQLGVLADQSARQALLDLYAGNDALGSAFRQGASSRMQSAQALQQESQRMHPSLDKDGTPAGTQAQVAQMQAASNGAADPVGLQLDAQHLGTLMRNDPKLRLGFLSAGGWDTHANQGNATGQLANRLGNLARGIMQLHQDFSQTGDTILVMSEFGRTCSENGTKGCDHGFGNALWLIGPSVHGGQWHGKWSGLAHGNLNDSRDLPAHHDYRGVLAQVLRRTFALSDTAMSNLLPNTQWDTRLDSLMRKG